MSSRDRPVSRWWLAAGVLALLVLLSGTVGLVEALRHPALEVPHAPPPDPEAADPRIPLDCPEPEPREGVERPDEPLRGMPERRVTSSQLYDCPDFWDGRPVRYRGEVVGAVLRRGDRAWVQLNDDVYAETLGPLPAHRDYRGANAGVGINIPRAAADQISMVGGPAAHGDLVEIRGVFRRVDAETREIAVIHATDVGIVRSGRAVTTPVLVDRAVAAYVVLMIAAAVAVAERLVARRRR
jgi:hypothetical protein